MSVLLASGFELIHDIVKLRWVPEIVIAIGEGNHQYSEILNSINEISHTELNRKLNVLLKKSAIIKKEEDHDKGYYLSSFGEDLEHIFKHFEEMSQKYIQQMEN